MDEETLPPSARALLPCLLPLDSLQQARDQNFLVLEPVDTLKQFWFQENTKEELFPWKKYHLQISSTSFVKFEEGLLLECSR
jgi:hypothetical protein